MKTLIIFFALASSTFAQEEDPLKYFPYKTSDMWEYVDLLFPDTLQNFNIKDSIDAVGNIYVTQFARRINPIQPPYTFQDTANFKIDTSYNVFGFYGGTGAENLLIYKLNAQLGDQWVVHIYQDSSNIYGYEIARVRYVWEDELFPGSGIYATFKNFTYYYSQDSTDTLGLVRYGANLVYGFGLQFIGEGDTFVHWELKGCVINDTLYGDTTNVITSVKDFSENLISDFELYPNYPNPFNPITTISFRVTKAHNISLIVYDIMGREVKRIIDNEYYYPGIYKTTWDGKNNSNQSVSSGVYYYRLIGIGINITRSMILMK